MLIAGRWLLCDDGVVRAVVECEAMAADGSWVKAEFLVDTGGDRTVLNAPFLMTLGLPHMPAPVQLGGVGGAVTTVCVGTQLRFSTSGHARLVIQGTFAGFTQDDALDMNVLGRDIMNLFAVIVDRPGNAVLMIGNPHKYVITQ